MTGESLGALRVVCLQTGNKPSTSYNSGDFASQGERKVIRTFFAKSLPKTPANSHVKSQNHLTTYKSTTSEWRFSYIQTAILDIELKIAPEPGFRTKITS